MSAHPALYVRVGTGRQASCRPKKLQIAIARDPAFCLLSQENIDSLAQYGQISYFSPLYGSDLPSADLVYLPGGYPELFARQLYRRKRLLVNFAIISKEVANCLPNVEEWYCSPIRLQSVREEQLTKWQTYFLSTLR